MVHRTKPVIAAVLLAALTAPVGAEEVADEPAAKPRASGFFTRLLGPSEPPSIYNDPLVITPPEQAAKPKKKRAPRYRKIVNVPLPRLRPAYPKALSIVEAEAEVGAVGADVATTHASTSGAPSEAVVAMDAGTVTADGTRVIGPNPHAPAISLEVTGAIAKPSTDETAILHELPPPVEVAAGGDAHAAPEAEELLPGDPAHLMARDQAEMAETTPPDAGLSPEATMVAEVVDASPYRMIRVLQKLQDQIAAGSMDAMTAQQELRKHIDEKFLAAAPEVWQDERNANAAVVYVLSGGPPQILRHMARLDPYPAIDKKLLAGVHYYVEGREADARYLLDGFDPSKINPTMGAQLALAKAALAVRADPVGAKRLLSLARLLAPGTLVEEAALRREIFVADQIDDAEAVEALSRRYLQRFRHSVYAGNFRNRFAAAVSRMSVVDSPAGYTRLDNMLAEMDADARGGLYLSVSLAAVVKGNTDGAAYAADRALELAPPGSGEEARAHLYRAAAMVVDPKRIDEAVAELELSRAVLLNLPDRHLYVTVQATLNGIREGTEDISPTQLAQLGSRKPASTDMSALIERGEAALRATDGLIAEATR